MSKCNASVARTRLWRARPAYSSVKPCQTLADDYARAGGKITVKVYPDAAHGWDGKLRKSCGKNGASVGRQGRLALVAGSGPPS